VGTEGRGAAGSREMTMRRNAFTLIELLVVISIIGLLISILLPSLGKARSTARQLKDATQIRGIHQSFVIWAQNNQGDYPLPSRLDTANATMTDDPATNKDNLGNIFSLLIYNAYVPTELMVSPSEVNPDIQEDLRYELDAPILAADPENALWDPGFTGVVDEQGTGTGNGRRNDGKIGHTSYAFNPPFGERRRRWHNTYSSDEAILGNRGPLFGGSVLEGWTLVPGQWGTESNTLKIHGGPQSWEGNVAFNDSRVVFETRADPEHIDYVFKGLPIGQRTQNDNIFVNIKDFEGEVDLPSRPGLNGNTFLMQYSNVNDNGGPAGPQVLPYWD
jgi:prepilin-type N-terminal cleavage/methylation domain-containing protein